MTTPLGSFQGIASGIQWRDLVDQIIQIESSRALGPISAALNAEGARVDGWTALAAAVSKAKEALATVKDGSAFRARTVTVANSATSGRTLAALPNVASATPGRYAVEVENLAQSEKLTGLAVASASTALGVSGRFSINGVSVTIETSDSLARVRDKINAANTGASASRVSATVNTVGGVARLVLNADNTGATGIELADDRSGPGDTSTLEALGFIDGSRAMNVGTDGKTRSMRISSGTLALANALGISTSPSPATVLINGRAITVDLQNDSLTDIVARINALSPGAAKVESDPDGSTAWSRLAIAGSVAGDGSAAADRVLEALGVRTGGRASNITQRVTAGPAMTGFGGATATGATLLTDLGAGSPSGFQAGDVITLTGTDGSGAAVSMNYTVTGTDTLDDLTAAMQTAFTGRAATVSVVNGQLTFTDSAAGDSRLAVTVSAGLQGGGTLDLSATSTTFGRIRQLTKGEDARILVDGAVLTSRTNTVAGAIGNAAITLQGEEDGTTFDVTITASQEPAVKAVQDFATAYNDLLTAVANETKTGGRLAHASSARAVLGAMKGVLLSDQLGLGATARYKRAGSVGVELQRNGQLKVDAAKLQAALASDASAVEALFTPGGAAADGNVQYVGAANVTPAGEYALAVTQAATRSTTLGGAFATYAAGPTPAKMTVLSEASGRSATITFVNGDTPATIAARLQAAFEEQAVEVNATVEGGAIRLTGTSYGTNGGFTVSYTDPGAEAPATQLGIAAGAYDTGVNAAGTLNGIAMTANGQVLTGVNGLIVRYTGTAATLSTTVRYARGVAGGISYAADGVIADGTGTAALFKSSAQTRIASLERRESDVTDRLERRRAALVAQFSKMESVLGKLQSQSSWLTSQITSMQNMNSSR